MRIVRAGAGLAADYRPVDGSRLAFVVTHGWGSARPADIPRALADAGCAALAHDLRAHGESDGELALVSRADWVADLVALIDWLRAELPDARIGLVGASFGAYLSVLAAAERDVACLSLRVPANYPDAGYDTPFVPQREGIVDSAWLSRESGPDENAALAALRSFGGPVQIVDADRDAVIPRQTVANYAAVVDPARLTRATLRDAPHHLADPRLRADYLALLVGWAKAVSARAG